MQNQNKQQKKPLISVKKYIDEIVQSWFAKNKEEIQDQLENVNFYSYISDEKVIFEMIQNHLHFALNVKEVSLTQQLATEWKENKQKMYSLCDKHFSFFLKKFEKLLFDAKIILLASERYKDLLNINEKHLYYFFVCEIVIGQFMVMLKYLPSKFDSFNVFEDFLLSQIETVEPYRH